MLLMPKPIASPPVFASSLPEYLFWSEFVFQRQVLVEKYKPINVFSNIEEMHEFVERIQTAITQTIGIPERYFTLPFNR